MTSHPNTNPASHPLEFTKLDEAEMIQRSRRQYAQAQQRRSVRDFATKAIPPVVIEQALLTAGTAPSGANRQPWHFAITTDPQVKAKIRLAAEQEEREFYSRRASQEWLDALAPLGTDANKPFLEQAPLLIGVFSQKFSYAGDGEQQKNYYTYESVGIACGMLISALHQSGLATLTHTPSPMKFLNSAFARPATERPYLLLVVGYPAQGCQVPTIRRKSLSEIASLVGNGDGDWSLATSEQQDPGSNR